MARRLLQVSVAAALIIAVGGHWAVLQSVAWVSMAVTYSKTDSLEVALKKTFDGRHPCKLCAAVKEASKRNKSSLCSRSKPNSTLFACKQSPTFIPPCRSSCSPVHLTLRFL